MYDAVSATDTCEPADSPLKLHLLSVRNRMESGIIRRFHWVDTRDMLADGLTKGGIDRRLLHQASNDCRLKVAHEVLTRTKSVPLPVPSGSRLPASEEDPVADLKRGGEQ